LNKLQTVEITIARTDDLPQLADLLAELFTLESDFIPDRVKQLRGLRMILEAPAMGQLFVLRVNGKVAGMANALITISTVEGGRVLILEDIILHKTYRGIGLGRNLVEYILGWACEQGLTRVTLLADQNNQAALDFYRKLGFERSQMTVLRKKM
jgi:ribosomal protein S18 acetylase RimI-like enzyme